MICLQTIVDLRQSSVKSSWFVCCCCCFLSLQVIRISSRYYSLVINAWLFSPFFSVSNNLKKHQRRYDTVHQLVFYKLLSINEPDIKYIWFCALGINWCLVILLASWIVHNGKLYIYECRILYPFYGARLLCISLEQP